MIIRCYKNEKGEMKFAKEGKIIYDYIIEKVPKGTNFDMILYPVGTGNKSNAQLAKIHVLIKEMAIEQGTSFIKMKRDVKDAAGYFFYDDHKKKVYKSFEHITLTELSLVIASVNEICDFLGIQNVNI